MRYIQAFAGVFLFSTGWTLPIASDDRSKHTNRLDYAQSGDIEQAIEMNKPNLEADNMSSQNSKRDLFDFLNNTGASSFKVGLPLPKTKATERNAIEMEDTEDVVIVGDSAWEGSINQHMNERRMDRDYVRSRDH